MHCLNTCSPSTTFYCYITPFRLLLFHTCISLRSKLIFFLRMATDSLHEQITSMRQSFFDEGHLSERFIEMEELQHTVDPNFIEDLVTVFLKDSTRVLATVELALEKPNLDFFMLDKSLHQFKGSTSSLGACKLLMDCNKTREYLKEKDIEKTKTTFQQLKEDHVTLKNKFATYFQLIKQAGLVETAERPCVKE